MTTAWLVTAQPADGTRHGIVLQPRVHREVYQRDFAASGAVVQPTAPHHGRYVDWPLFVVGTSMDINVLPRDHARNLYEPSAHDQRRCNLP